MYSRLQHHVHQLLCVQQTRRGCCSHGANFGEIVSEPGKSAILVKSFKSILSAVTYAMQSVNLVDRLNSMTIRN